MSQADKTLPEKMVRKVYRPSVRFAYPVSQWAGSIFSRKALEKISTLKSLTDWIFAVALRRRQYVAARRPPPV
jgi:hypothetical protein